MLVLLCQTVKSHSWLLSALSLAYTVTLAVFWVLLPFLSHNGMIPVCPCMWFTTPCLHGLVGDPDLINRSSKWLECEWHISELMRWPWHYFNIPCCSKPSSQEWTWKFRMIQLMTSLDTNLLEAISSPLKLFFLKQLWLRASVNRGRTLNSSITIFLMLPVCPLIQSGSKSDLQLSPREHSPV